MTIEEIKEKGKCCITEKPLKDCRFYNAVQLDLKATWKYPVWGNIVEGIPAEFALAFVHDDCIDPKTGQIIGEVKFALEATETEIIYHPISELKP